MSVNNQVREDNYRSARIAALRRYIDLLRQEEKRLGWVRAHAGASSAGRTEADEAVRMNAQKLDHADEELRELVSQVRPRNR